jgi:hypothetical protein
VDGLMGGTWNNNGLASKWPEVEEICVGQELGWLVVMETQVMPRHDGRPPPPRPRCYTTRCGKRGLSGW